MKAILIFFVCGVLAGCMEGPTGPKGDPGADGADASVGIYTGFLYSSTLIDDSHWDIAIGAIDANSIIQPYVRRNSGYRWVPVEAWNYEDGIVGIYTTSYATYEYKILVLN